MLATRDKIRLHGFNNLTKAVSFNLYAFFLARSESERRVCAAAIDEKFNANRITKVLRRVAEIIDADVLSVSAQDYEPHGASALLLMGERCGHVSVGAHLTKSHICAHTYPDWTDPKGICSFRIDIDVATCGAIVPLRALDFMLQSFDNDVIVVDYVVRGSTRDADGRRVYLDHSLRSIQDFIDPQILSSYHCEDLILQHQNIWRTKMRRDQLDAKRYFPEGVDPYTAVNRSAFEDLRREMAGIFHGWCT